MPIMLTNNRPKRYRIGAVHLLVLLAGWYVLWYALIPGVQAMLREAILP